METYGQTNVRKRLKILLIIMGILVLVALIWIALIIFFYSGAQPYVPKPVYSPDGTRVIIPTINFNKADKDKYLLVHIKIQNTKSDETLFQVQTRASDRMRWSVDWIGNNTLILNSSDIGSYCWEENNDRWKETQCP
jgi:flagellar basal body-associated protein FliL